MDLHKLLPKNQTHVHPAGEKNNILDCSTNQPTAEDETGKKDLNTSLDLWVLAFSVFQVYKAAINPKLAIPLLKYLDRFCMLAEAELGYFTAFKPRKMFLPARST